MFMKKWRDVQGPDFGAPSQRFLYGWQLRVWDLLGVCVYVHIHVCIYIYSSI